MQKTPIKVNKMGLQTLKENIDSYKVLHTDLSDGELLDLDKKKQSNYIKNYMNTNS